MDSDITQSAIFFRLWSWIETHFKQVLMGVVVVAAIAFIGGLYLWRQDQKQVNANEALSTVLDQGLGGDPLLMADALVKVAAAYPHTDAGARATLMAGSRLFAGGKYAEAETQFAKYLSDNRDAPFAGQAALGAAACMDAQGKTNEAVVAYQNITERRGDDIAAPQATLALGRMFEARGDLQQARDYYMKIARQEYGPIGSEAGAHLQELIAQHADLIPARVSPTNAPVIMKPPKAE